MWQTVFFVALRGWPVNLIDRRPLRLLAGNALVIGGGAASYLVLRDLANLSPQAIGAACGCVISAGLTVALVFEGYRLLSVAVRAGYSPVRDRFSPA